MHTITFLRRDFVTSRYRLYALTTPRGETAWTVFAALRGVIRPRLWARGHLIATRTRI